MLTIALTGGIGSGKTAVTDLFQDIAAQSDNMTELSIIDADTIARQLLSGSLYKSPSPALKSVYDLFGSEIFDNAGQLDRAQLRSLIFASTMKKQQLEALLHPLVYKEIFAKIAHLAQQTDKALVIISIPLLFETKTEHLFDRILLIDIPVELQITRSTLRDKCTANLVKKIIKSQAERQVRLDHADDIIDNSGSLSELRSKVADLFQYYSTLVYKNEPPPRQL